MFQKTDIKNTRPAVMLVFILLAGCMAGPDYIQPDLSSGPEIGTGNFAALSTEQTNIAEWWDIFEDSLLTSLIKKAAKNNLDLKIAVARVREAREQLGISTSNLFPVIDATGQIKRTKDSKNLTGKSGKPYTQYSIGMDTNWEIDLFGRIRRSIEANFAEHQAYREDRNNVLVTLCADVATTYFTLRSLQAQIDTTENNILSQKRMLALTRVRYKYGLATYLDVAQAMRVLATTEATLPPLRAQFTESINALSVLLGEAPGGLTELLIPRPIPFPPEKVAIGIPAEQIRKRPDVKQAERLLAAETAKIGVAKADLYPTFSFLGSFGYASLNTGNLIESSSGFYGTGPSIRWNIFDMGRIRRAIKVQDARTEQALHAYELTMLQAIKEVRDSLTNYQEQRNRLKALTRAVESSKDALKMATRLYKDGLTDFQNVLDAQRTLLSTEQDMQKARGNTCIELAQIYKALGGGWDSDSYTKQKKTGKREETIVDPITEKTVTKHTAQTLKRDNRP